MYRGGRLRKLKLSELQPNVYPVHLLMDCDSGLCLFGAGFYGANDAIHMFHTSMPYVHVVDNDVWKMNEMRVMYPSEWVFSTADVTTWVPNVASASVLSWDIVSVDSPQNMFDWCWNNIDDLLKLANKYAVLTTSDFYIDRWTDTDEWVMAGLVNRSTKALTSLVIFERRAPAPSQTPTG